MPSVSDLIIVRNVNARQVLTEVHLLNANVLSAIVIMTVQATELVLIINV